MSDELTSAERASCFECVSGFWAGATATVTNGYGVMLSISDLATLTNDINSRLDAIALDATARAKIKALVVRWDVIAGQFFEFSGNIGDVSGVTTSSEKMKDAIRAQMETYLHVFHMIDGIKRRNGERNHPASVSFSIGR